MESTRFARQKPCLHGFVRSQTLSLAIAAILYGVARVNYEGML